VPLVVVVLSVVNFEGATITTASSERQMTVTKIRTGHVGRHKVADHKYQTGSRFRPEVDVQRSTATTMKIVAVTWWK